MFYVIKHIPTNSWVPQLKSPNERVLYYHFLDNTPLPSTAHGIYVGFSAQKVPEAKELTFERGFKYQNKELAIGFVKALASKLRNQGKPAAEIEKDFKVLEYSTWPIEQLTLNNKATGVTAPAKVLAVVEVKDNWYGLSKVYCSKCGAYIPVKVRYLHLGPFNLCPECVKEISESIADEFNKYPDRELIEAVLSERFVAHL